MDRRKIGSAPRAWLEGRLTRFPALLSWRRFTRIPIALLPDSGYAPLNLPELFAHLQPQVVLLSVAPGNSQGLPSPETLKVLPGYNLLRTDLDGWIELVTDGGRMWVEVERR